MKDPSQYLSLGESCFQTLFKVKAKKLAIRSLDGTLKFGVSTDKFIKDLLSDIEHKC